MVYNEAIKMTSLKKHFFFCSILLASVAGIFAAAPNQVLAATVWNKGDVFAEINGGSYKVYNNNGVFKETINNGIGGMKAGCAFSGTLDKLYTTNFTFGKVEVYNDAIPHILSQTIDTGAVNPGGTSESIVFAANGDFYVGHADGNGDIQKYNSAGVYQQSYNVATEDRGSDWIDLASDQKTMFYTSEGGSVKRYDVSTNTQLPDFASIGGISYALRLLPPGDGSGGLLVAHNADIVRLNGSGTIIQTYDAPGENAWFALNLDPNGTSFWSGDTTSGNFYRFDITTGAVEVGPIATGGSVVAGLCIRGELAAAGPPTPTPPPPPAPVCTPMPGGLVPCGRCGDDPDTLSWNETDPCEIKHLFLLLRNVIDFLLWKLIPLIIAILAIATGVIFYFSLGSANTLVLVRAIWRGVIKGVLILLLSWLFLNLLLSLLGFQINIFGHWTQIKV